MRAYAFLGAGRLDNIPTSNHTFKFYYAVVVQIDLQEWLGP